MRPTSTRGPNIRSFSNMTLVTQSEAHLGEERGEEDGEEEEHADGDSGQAGAPPLPDASGGFDVDDDRRAARHGRHDCTHRRAQEGPQTAQRRRNGMRVRCGLGRLIRLAEGEEGMGKVVDVGGLTDRKVAVDR